MGKLAFFWGIGLRIICRAQAGREYWRGRVWQSSGRSESGGKSHEARGQFDHGANSPKAARYALGIDHKGARIKAHPRGLPGPDFFVLTAGE